MILLPNIIQGLVKVIFKKTRYDFNQYNLPSNISYLNSHFFLFFNVNQGLSTKNLIKNSLDVFTFDQNLIIELGKLQSNVIEDICVKADINKVIVKFSKIKRLMKLSKAYPDYWEILQAQLSKIKGYDCDFTVKPCGAGGQDCVIYLAKIPPTKDIEQVMSKFGYFFAKDYQLCINPLKIISNLEGSKKSCDQSTL